MATISVRNDFDEEPMLRHCTTSDNSGEEFYHKVLNGAFMHALEAGEKLIVDLDGTSGYASSFLDEAFGNLVYDFTLERVKKYVEIVSTQEPHWRQMILGDTFSEWEERRVNGVAPIVTATHPPWYRYTGNRFEADVWESPA